MLSDPVCCLHAECAHLDDPRFENDNSDACLRVKETKGSYKALHDPDVNRH